MSIKSIREDAQAQVDLAKLKVEALYAGAVEAGQEASDKARVAYTDAVDELNDALEDLKELQKTAQVFMKAYGLYVILGGLGLVVAIGVGYASGWFSG